MNLQISSGSDSGGYDEKKIIQNNQIMDRLSDYQKEIVLECLEKKSGGLSLPMGSGKTLISLVVALQLAPPDTSILIVVPKTLLPNWEQERRKFFPDVTHEILHPEYTDLCTWTPQARLVLTTSQTLTRMYRHYGIENHFVYRVPNEAVGYTNVYQPPANPLLSPALCNCGAGLVYTMRWGALVVDEAHGFCNILVDKCRSIASVCSQYRWLLSGTLFAEPKPANILGYYVMINHPDNPGCLGHTSMLLRNRAFPGVRPTLVHRDSVPVPPPYDIDLQIIETPLTEEETRLYTMGREILTEIGRELEKMTDTQRRRRFSAYLLSMITYLRQSLIAPIIVLASIALDICKIEERSHLSIIINQQLHQASLGDWLESPSSLCSSRMSRVLQCLQECGRRRVIIFSAFRTALRLLQHFIKDRVVFTLHSSASCQEKAFILERFAESEDGVLLLTYRMGAEGLNLQCCDTVFLLDTLWNATTSSQAIARVARQGQMSKVVTVRIFVGNTGLESAILKKHVSKLQIGQDIMDGPTLQKYSQMKMKDVLQMVEDEANGTLCRKTMEYSEV